MDADVYSVDPSKTACTPTDVLLYCYYGGLLEIGRCGGCLAAGRCALTMWVVLSIIVRGAWADLCFPFSKL